MKNQLIFKINKSEVIVEAQAGEHKPKEIGRLTNFRYPDIMLDCVKVFYQHHKDWLLDGKEEDDFKTGGEAQAVPATSFSPVMSSPKQRIKYRDWEAIGKSSAGIIYKEVVTRILEEYKEGIEPKQGIISKVIREMYGEHLTKSSLISYASVYKRYIRENKLAPKPLVKKPKTNNPHIGEPIVKHSQIEYNPKGKYLLPIKKVLEIWDLLPDEFEYKQVKALVPAYIMQSASRIATAKFIIKQFLEIAEFECEETTPGVFKKKFEDV